MIRANAARYPISARCRILGVPRSTYYWMTGHPGTERADPIAGDVRAVWRDGRERYGAGKIKAALERKGCHRVQETHRQHHARTGHDERVHAQTIQTARYSRAWFRLLVSNRGSFVLTNEEIVRGTRAMPFTSKTETQSAQEFGHYRYRRITVDRHAGFH